MEKHMRKFLLALILAFVMVFAAACGDNNDGGGDAPPAATGAEWDAVIDATVARLNAENPNYNAKERVEFESEYMGESWWEEDTYSLDGNKLFCQFEDSRNHNSRHYYELYEEGYCYKYITDYSYNNGMTLPDGKEYFKVKMQEGSGVGRFYPRAVDIGEFKGAYKFFEYKNGKYVLKEDKVNDLAVEILGFSEEDGFLLGMEVSFQISGGLVAEFILGYEYEFGGYEAVKITTSLQYGGVTVTLPSDGICEFADETVTEG